MHIPQNTTITKDKKNELVSALIYGKPMVGKTFMSTTFPNPLFLNTDGNTQDINREVIDLRKEQEVTFGEQTMSLSKWNLFKAYVKYFQDTTFIQQLKEDGYQTIIIDVADHLYDWCRRVHLDRKGLNDESEDSYWAVLNDIRKDFKDTMVSFIESISPHFNLLMIGFESVEEYQDGLDKKLRVVPSLKTKMENGKGQDKHKVFEAMTSRLMMYGVVTTAFLNNENGEPEEVRIFISNTTSDHSGGNRFGIKTPLYPTYQSIKENIK